MWSLYFFNFPPPEPKDEVARLVCRVEEQGQQTKDLLERLEKFFRDLKDHIHKLPYPSTGAASGAKDRSS